MIKLKTDFHIHTSEDREDNIRYSSWELIDFAAQKGFGALAITNHNTFTFSRDLENYAEDKGILLIPGIEKTISGKHVLLLNAFSATEKIHTFADLRKAKSDGLFVIAPHPFFKTGDCLEEKLFEHLELFDALEFSYFYAKGFNLNRGVLKLAKAKCLPVVGNSDCHFLKYLGICHSTIEIDERSTAGVFDAIRAQNVEVVSRPQSLPKLASIFVEMIARKYIAGLQKKKPAAIFVPQKPAEKVVL